jgi:hypothetical protein
MQPICRGCDHGYRVQHFVDVGARRHSHLRSEVHRTQGFTQVQPLRRVKGIRPVRSITQWRITIGGLVGGYAKSNVGKIGSQMVCFLGSTSGVYIDTPDLGLHEDKSESHQLLLIRDSGNTQH